VVPTQPSDAKARTKLSLVFSNLAVTSKWRLRWARKVLFNRLRHPKVSRNRGQCFVPTGVTLNDSGTKDMTIRLEKHMVPPSEATKLESKGHFVEYVGSGKLKDKKVLITGGEYVHQL
jgi:hypothetical protein